MLLGRSGVRVAVLMILFCAGFQGPPETAVAQSTDDSVTESVEKLRQLREDIEGTRRRAEELGGREKNVLAEIETLEQSLDLTGKILDGLKNQEAGLARELGSIQTALDESGDRLRWRKQELARALRQMYKRGQYHSLEILFSSRSFPNLLERVRFLGSVAGRNRQMLRQVEEEQVRHDQAYQALVSRSRDLETLRGEKEKEQRRIETNVRERTGILEGIRNEKSEYERMVEDLEQSAKALESLIARMEAAATYREVPGEEFKALKGRLLVPVEGEVVVSFGKHRHPKFGTVTFSNGVDFRAHPGAPVRAVAPGVVEHVSWLTGYGQCAILGHGSGYHTLYAHLSEVLVEVGQEVGGGATIGTVGDTGSLIGPALHFEIRHGRDALDPALWLQSR